ncbi:MAG: choice-of-anchor L domain-containing protein [Coleofasciculus sp. B1-GNL1-01]|uniref:choice-of-anchor L domain-containing protein n=1 Tax=Coleofasciculus sp. B1-GNL1-01 TaxID=3068484 RepID=UPI0032F52653
MGLLPIKTTTTTIATTALLSLGGLPAMAFTITPTSNTDLLLYSLLGDTTGLTNFALELDDDNPDTQNTKAFGLFSNDPFGLDEGIVLSTGKVEDLPGENEEDGGIEFLGGEPPNDLSTDFEPVGSEENPQAGVRGDKMTLELSFDADETAEKLFFEYVFGSEEFREFGGDPEQDAKFNDSFELLLNGQNLALLTDGQEVTINNLIPNREDSSSYHPDYINNPKGSPVNTKLDGYTEILTFEGLLNKNARNTIEIKIWDVADGQLDSAVFVKGKSLGTKDPQLNTQPNDDPSDEPQSPPEDPVTDPGTLFPPDDPEPQSVPEPSGLLGLLGVATLGVRTMIRRKQKAHLQEH